MYLRAAKRHKSTQFSDYRLKREKDAMTTDEKFNRDMRATIKELNALRKRLAELIDNSDTPQIEGIIDIDFMIDFVVGFTKEAMREDHVVDMFEEAKPYWELLEWGEK